MANIAPTPKVAAAVIGGIIASAFLANITLITPDLFAGLGKWSGLVYGLTITLVMGVCGWLKSEEAKTESGAQDATSAAVPATGIGWQGDGHGVAHDSPAPAAQFPAAKVEAALAAVEPAPVVPVLETPPAPAA